MDVKESIKLFLPKYLSPNEQEKLISCINEFPNNINQRFYTQRLRNELTIFQGDGILGLPVVDLPNTNLKMVPCLILSNTCDVDDLNERMIPNRLTYSPIISLKKYISILEVNKFDPIRVNSHIKAIKNQDITQIFYLPSTYGLEESIVFLDRINNCSNTFIERQDLKKSRIFTLSNLGFYLLLLKLSMSFSRIAEKVDRPIEDDDK